MDWQRVSTWARRAAVRAASRTGTGRTVAGHRRHLPFLERLTRRRRPAAQLVAHFLQRKEFSGAHGLVITDAMAVAIAAQACVPLLHWGEPADALRWYDDFVGIVVHPDDVVARRKVVDEAGVVHHYREVLMGEAMEGGPVMLSWAAVQPATPPMAATPMW
jgi:Mlc titration factor MtfA (ptsG expression regulator)